MYEYRAVWNVTGGGVGYSVFHVREPLGSGISDSANNFAADLRAGLVTLGGDLPNDVTISFESEAREIDTATGNLLGVHAVTPPANVVGIQTGTYAAPSGAKVELITGAIVGGRRLKGRTFIVPLAGTSYENNGMVSAGAIGRLNTAFNMFRDAVGEYSLAVWSRPQGAPTPRAGVLADVLSVAASQKAAILRSRRD